MNSTNSTDKPLNVFAWVTIWERETIIASIAHDKVHIVERTVSSNNSESGIANPNAKRTEGFRAMCGTTRRGRYFAVAADADVTCAKCAKIAR